ncbi:MAG: NADH-quinone oxidoreductase subunit J, partial [Acidobacteriota bacterium]|nr:NADH-quinone oxidoreductase subunit J [Acidobacteriota bacterium]
MFATTYAVTDVLVFAGATLLIITGALGVIVMKNPVHSALSLILALLGVAVAFLAQNADFLAAVEIIVYAGAIVVL